MPVPITISHGMLSIFPNHSGLDQTGIKGFPHCYIDIIILTDYQAVRINYRLYTNLFLRQVS